MSLALCLVPDGDCSFTVFRQEETHRIPRRLGRILGLAPSEICIVPEVEGFATRRLHYSDECRLMDLIAQTPGILDEALDYSVNFAFALDEGLDPDEFLMIGQDMDEDEPEVAEPTAPSRAEPQVRPSDRLPRFMRAESEDVPGLGFRSARQIEAEEKPPEIYMVGPEDNGWVVIECTEARGPELRVSDPAKVFLRDDKRAVALAAEPSWPTPNSLPARLRVRAANLPQTLCDVLENNVGRARVRRIGNFIHIQFEPQYRAQPARIDQRVAPPEPVAMLPQGHAFDPTVQSGGFRSPEVEGMRRGRKTTAVA